MEFFVCIYIDSLSVDFGLTCNSTLLYLLFVFALNRGFLLIYLLLFVLFFRRVPCVAHIDNCFVFFFFVLPCTMRRKYYTKNNRFISVAFKFKYFLFCFVLQIEIVTRSIYNIYEGGTLLPIMLKLLAVQRDLLLFF